MVTIPFRHLTFHSKLSPSDIENHLAEIVVPSIPIFLWRVPAGKIFSGDFSQNTFRLKRLWGYGANWIPTFRGVINRASGGSDIDVIVSLEGFDSILIIALHLIVLGSAVLTVFEVGFNVGFVLFLFTSLIFGLADGLGYYLGFVRGVRYFESEIHSVLSRD